VRGVRGRRAIAAVMLAGLVAAPATLLTRSGSADPAGPPPTPVPPDGHPSPFPQTLHTPADPVPPPAIAAQAAILVDLDTGQVLDRKAADIPRPIASLTKLMTALLVVERTQPSDVVTVAPDAVYPADRYGASSTLGLRTGERQTVEDLLYGLLLGSANDAADALAIHVAGSTSAFVALMNDRARALGMTNTRFRSASGLDDRGRSTPRDLARLARAVEAVPLLRTIVATRFHAIPAPKGPDRRIQNRNALLWLDPSADGVKTGSTAAAGACVIATSDRGGRRLLVVVLHAPEEAFSDAAALLRHGAEGFADTVLAQEGEDRGSLRIEGGRVAVVAGATLERLVPIAGDGVVAASVADPGAAFPPAPGEVVGTLTFRTGGLTLGSVPLLAGAVAPPEPIEGAWWVRALRAVAGAGREAVHGLAT
jgi:serine-type D-Ala-D-Ala carboxypeptidase (penicillin-binding protein 5/6)